MSPVRRWVLHPSPGMLESLSSYAARLAVCYGMTVSELIADNLGLVGVTIPEDLDHSPPAQILAALAERTGVEPAQLHAMTLAGWVPWLFDTLDPPPEAVQPMFDAYVRDNNVLLASGEIGTQVLARRRRWPGLWVPLSPPLRTCPVCATDPDRGTTLVWRLALMTGCVEHGCRLEDTVQVSRAIVAGEAPPGPVPLEGPVATVDHYTYQALTTGRVDLPGHSVHAGVWFRLLRALLDELTASASTVSGPGRRTLRRVWEEAGITERAGLRVWKPYECLDADAQDELRRAAGTALQLAADGAITARGRLAAALRPPADRYVYAGDPPDPYETARQAQQVEFNRQGARALLEANEWFEAARTHPDMARQILLLLTYNLTGEAFDRERRFMIDLGIPAEFLLDAPEPDRADLV